MRSSHVCAEVAREVAVEITFVAKDPDSEPSGSPTLYRTDRDSWVVQGWAVTDPDVLFRCPTPAALSTSAAPITSTASARRTRHDVGNNT
jgi:hypothetical protein